MHGNDDLDNEITPDAEETMDEHHIEITVTDLEWEIINQALNAPVRGHVLKMVRQQGYNHDETIIESTWDELIERWGETW
jgi:hypothetical protein